MLRGCSNPSNAIQSNVEEKLIRERTGHKSNALLAYEKKSDEQALEVSNVLGPQTATVNASTAEKVRMQNIIDSDFSLFDFDVPDDRSARKHAHA